MTDGHSDCLHKEPAMNRMNMECSLERILDSYTICGIPEK